VSVTEEPDVRNSPVRLCVQIRLVCSAGDSPARATIRSPIAWMAGRKETEYLKPIDKEILKGYERVTGP
jgi:hypothetical protein